MPKEVHNQLTAAKVRQEKRPGRYADGNGLYLNVAESGARWWVWRGTVYGRRTEIGMGSARLVDLTLARERAREFRNIAHSGGDPRAERDREKREKLTFADAARRVYAEQIEPHARNAKAVSWLTSLERHAFPSIGRIPVAVVRMEDVLRTLVPIWNEKPETARKVRQRMRTVFNWARVAGHRQEANPVEGVTAGLPRQRERVQHFAAMSYEEVPAFMGRLGRASGMGALALRFTILTAVRSGETRGATWEEIDLAAATWTIPAERMKADREHRIPLSMPALEVLERLQPIGSRLVFPNSSGNPLSDMTLLAVLKRMNLDVTVHGFRSSFRDWAEETTRYPHAVKEAALAHQVKSKVERAYRRTDLFEKRRSLMDEWAAFCCPPVGNLNNMDKADAKN